MFTFPVSHYSGANTVALGDRSMSFASASTRYLSMSAANWGVSSLNKALFSVSLWYKRASIGSMYLINIGDNTLARAFDLLFDGSDKIRYRASSDGATFTGELDTTATYTDTASWHHILTHYDSANATANSRMRLWYDGTEVTLFDTRTNPSSAIFNSTGNVTVGISGGITGPYDGLLYQVKYYSGLLVDISTVYSSGHPLLSSKTSLFSLLNENSTDAVTVDKIISTGWTNTNTVSQSSTIPT